MVKRLMLVSVLALLLLSGLAAGIAAGTQDFTLVNKTGVDIYEVYISPFDANDWEEDVLDVDILADGEEVDIVFDGRSETYWDIMVKDKEGNSLVWRKFNLKEISQITLYYDAKKGEGRAEYK